MYAIPLIISYKFMSISSQIKANVPLFLSLMVCNVFTQSIHYYILKNILIYIIIYIFTTVETDYCMGSRGLDS